MTTPTRITDRTPEQFGDPIRFEILTNQDGTLWVVLARWSDTPDTAYDGRGEGPTIEFAMSRAVADMNDED